MTSWYTAKIMEIESQLESLESELPDYKKTEFREKLRHLRYDIEGGIGLSLTGAPNDFMLAKSFDLDNRLKGLKHEVEVETLMHQVSHTLNKNRSIQPDRDSEIDRLNDELAEIETRLEDYDYFDEFERTEMEEQKDQIKDEIDDWEMG